MQNPNLGNLQKCDPYSSFGIFCDADSYIEGFIIILATSFADFSDVPYFFAISAKEGPDSLL